ncbi:MAG: hypothetical protein ABEJ65_06305, partial [bacterium]
MASTSPATAAVYVPPRGGRSSYDRMLVESFQALGFEAREMMSEAIVKTTQNNQRNISDKES